MRPRTLTILALGCLVGCGGGPRPGLYKRVEAKLFEKGKAYPIPDPDVLSSMPASIRIERGQRYELDMRVARLRGTFRWERDSIFIQEGGSSAQKVTAAGVLRGDTLIIQLFGVAAALGAPPGVEVSASFAKTSE